MTSIWLHWDGAGDDRWDAGHTGDIHVWSILAFAGYAFSGAINVIGRNAY
ncbi:MAG: hypothetical protein JO138_22165 [Acidobacteriaceae bacterium]|nr:hypothetical protein [Acidobacteriaceae bacterium]